MNNVFFRLIDSLRESYWLWPSVMTLAAIVMGFGMPALDAQLGTEWVEDASFAWVREAEGARTLLATLAGAILGVAGVAFSITIVAVSFASSNYGPRLIGNFMSDTVNQLVLGIFVANFTYCVSVLTTVRSRTSVNDVVIEAFVPQISIALSLALSIVSIAALIVYIHHIPESINIMNLTERIGGRLRTRIIDMLDAEDRRERDLSEAVDVASWTGADDHAEPAVLRAPSPGYLQQYDLNRLDQLARQHRIQISLERAPGDFVAAQERLMSVAPLSAVDEELMKALHGTYTLGATRTSLQDVRFLSDQLVEVTVRALSKGVNDPHTAMLCLDWLRAGLAAFARRQPSQPTGPGDPVRYRRVTFEIMLDRSFDRMRQYVATDRTVTLYALGALADIGAVASRQKMASACARQMKRLARSALELQAESLAHEEIEQALAEALQHLEERNYEMGEGRLRTI